MEVHDRIVTTCNSQSVLEEAQDSVQKKLKVGKVLYGLACIQLSRPDLDRLDAFQVKGPRRSLKIPPASINLQHIAKKVLDILQMNQHTQVTQVEQFFTTWRRQEGQADSGLAMITPCGKSFSIPAKKHKTRIPKTWQG